MRYTIFGESHGPAIGVVIEAPPPGLLLDEEFLSREMARRAPGNSPLATPRKEKDRVEYLSGVLDGRTTGTPLCAVIRNTDTHSSDYAGLSDTPRPSHGDYTGSLRYKGFADVRGGGHFSGRLTAPLVFAGAVAKLALLQHGVSIHAAISEVGGKKSPSPEEIEAVILAAKQDGDSVGGVIACEVTGLRAGLGAPDFGKNVEGIFSQYLFSIPAVKGVAFGAGFGFAAMRGSEANDPFRYEEDGSVSTVTNHAGGVNGGITNGMPVTFEAVFRPTPSIAKPQQTVSLSGKTETTLTIPGRHDPCILPRAVVVVEAAAALAACELLGI